MDKLKPIHHKEFHKFIKGRRFRGRNDYTLKDLKAKFGFKLLKIERRALVVSLEDMEPTTFSSMREATKLSTWEKASSCMQEMMGGTS